MQYELYHDLLFIWRKILLDLASGFDQLLSVCTVMDGRTPDAAVIVNCTICSRFARRQTLY